MRLDWECVRAVLKARVRDAGLEMSIEAVKTTAAALVKELLGGAR